MKRLLLGVMLILLAGTSWAANKYVDSGCTFNGNGAAVDCAASGGAAGPWNSMDNALAAWACGDTVNVRGVHATHGSNHAGGTTTGIYRTDKWNITTSCTSGSQLIIQAYGWTAAGAATQELVYTEAVKTLTSGDWTQCTWDGSACDCDAGNPDVQIGAGGSTACTETWWHTKTGDGSNRTYWATKPDGSITPRRDLLSQMTAQYDANDPEGTATLLVRWGGSLPADPSVNFSSNGNQWYLNGADYVTVRGFQVRRAIRAVFYANATADNNTFRDNVVKYINDSANGSARAVEIDSSSGNSIIDNEFAYTSAEPLHITTLTDGSVSGTIARNWVHNIGDVTALGNGTLGTPNCTTFTNDASSGNPTSGIASPWDTGDNTGLTVTSNIFDTCNERDPAKGAYGIYLESSVKNAVFSHNIITGVASCIELRPFHSTPINGGVNGINTNTFYDNICFSPVVGTHDSDRNCFNLNPDGQASPLAAINGNVFWNNTCAKIEGTCIATGTGSGLGNTTTNTFKNNICSKTTLTSPSNFLVNNSQGGLTLGNNLSWSGQSSGQCGTLAGVAYNCSSAPVCGDPLFANTANNDYHIQSASPAKDAGTATGMPVAHLVDINNTIASAHSLPSYADGQAQAGASWDIGADEFASGSSVNMTIGKTDSPDPAVPGNNITYTLAYSNTGGTDATGVTITDTVPTNTTFVSANAGGAFGGGSVTWSLGTVIAGGSGTVQMVVQVTSPLADGTVISNNYSIASTEQGTVTGTTDTTTVTSAPFLVLGKADSPDPVLAGSNLTYTISYSNTGTAGATGVVITDTVPVNTTFVSATGGGTLGGGVVTWTIGPVNAGASSTVQMVVQVGAGVANGATITNATYAMASNELSTLTGSPVTTTVTSTAQTTPQFVLPITQRTNTWSAMQTQAAEPGADLVQSANTGQWIRGQATELLTLSTSGATTDTSANLLPANSIIEAVVARITTTITVATDWKVGDPTQAARFTSANATMTAGTTAVGLNHQNPTVASADLGPVQTAAAKVRISTTGTPGAGAIRITVFYRQFVPPGS